MFNMSFNTFDIKKSCYARQIVPVQKCTSYLACDVIFREVEFWLCASIVHCQSYHLLADILP